MNCIRQCNFSLSISPHDLRLGRLAAAMLTVGVAAWIIPASAEVFSIEGPIQSITDNGDDSGDMTCMGITMQIPAGTPIHSPTASLTITELADSASFPSSEKAGFVGGTCIVAGNNDSGPNIAEDIFVELAENVLVGPVGTISPFNVLGIEIVPLADPRMPLGEAANQFGFGVDLATVPEGDLSAAEGYLGTDGKLYAHTIETTEGTVLDTTPRASIQRAQCENRGGRGQDRLTVLGGAIIPAGQAPGAVEICQANAAGVCVGATFRPTVATDPQFPPFGAYRLTRSNLTFSSCQPQVKVIYRGVTTFAPLDAR